ncbi:MAG TPA: hypothetical protein VJ646_11250 [Candidatus Binatia bacterium]|nr:hypothetical protein [Candidatus Binatia bacterium]
MAVKDSRPFFVSTAKVAARRSRNQKTEDAFNHKDLKEPKVENQSNRIDSHKGAMAARCHFDRREKSFLAPSHSLGMTDRGPSLCVFGVAPAEL